MYSTSAVLVKSKPDNLMSEYLSRLCHQANNMYNATLFRIRQVMTAVKKNPCDRQPNEKEVMKEISDSLPKMKKGTMPDEKHWLLSYPFLASLMVASHNPDYYAEGFSTHAAQAIMKQACLDMRSWIESCKEFKKNPLKFKGYPKLPRYKKSGGLSTVKLSNQVCQLVMENGKTFLKFPKTKLRLQVQSPADGMKLKEVSIKPVHGGFEVRTILDNGIEDAPIEHEPRRAAFLDLGVRNFASMTNNVGIPNLLFKGGIAKSINQKAAKELARIQSKQTKGTTDKFVMTDEARDVLQKRHNQLSDLMHKTAKRIVSYCMENGIDTLVVGANHFWKQNSDMGRKENQKFTQMPHYQFRSILKYLCQREGIQYLEHEESYTSKADFTAKDPIPVYGKESGEIKFSGNRSPRWYNGQFRKNGFHGLYVTHDGKIINSDMNGSANIGRKAIPGIFDRPEAMDPDFGNVIVIKHPDEDRIKANKEKQACQEKKISRSKQKRLNRKAAKQSNVIPLG